MLKPLIAGITALSLSFATAAPAQANGLDRDDVGKIVIGLAALAALGVAIDNNRSDEPTLRVHDRSRNWGNGNRSWSDLNRPRQRSNHRHDVLPRSCLRDVQTRSGTHRLLARRCLERNYARVNRLPNRCAVRLYTSNGPRRGFDPFCLRDQGYRISRRH